MARPPSLQKGGPTAEPGPATGPPTWSDGRTTPGPMAGPPNVENMGLDLEQELPRARVELDTSDLDAESVLDRLFKARPKDHPDSRIQEARRWLHGYAAKFPARGQDQPHPPDDQILAQFLAIAPWERLLGVMYDLMAERKQCGQSYAWFVTVALQRIHGIKPDAVKARREELKLVKGLPKTLAAKMGKMNR